MVEPDLTGHRWQYNTAHAHCVLDNRLQTHLFRLRNTYCFPIATVDTRTRLSVTLRTLCVLLVYVHRKQRCGFYSNEHIFAEVWLIGIRNRVYSL